MHDLSKPTALDSHPTLPSESQPFSPLALPCPPWQGPRRLFFGVAPSASQVEQLREVLLQLPASLKPVLESNLHLTLRFLGQVTQPQALALCQQLNTYSQLLALPAFVVRLEQLECWAGPKVLCLAGAVEDAALASLDALLDQLALEQGLAVRQHPLRPHISLARHARSTEWLTFEPLHTLKPMVLVANELRLYHSESTADGVRYRVLASWPLHSKGRHPNDPQDVTASD